MQSIIKLRRFWSWKHFGFFTHQCIVVITAMLNLNFGRIAMFIQLGRFMVAMFLELDAKTFKQSNINLIAAYAVTYLYLIWEQRYLLLYTSFYTTPHVNEGVSNGSISCG